MKSRIFNHLRAVSAVGVVMVLVGASDVSAQQKVLILTKDGYVASDTLPEGKYRSRIAEQYTPTIWVDPDGCEHWVMDDGFEGFMTPHVTRDGKPVCGRTRSCATMGTDQLFATDKFSISAANRKKLAAFFQKSTAQAYIIEGHTDSRASDNYNLALSRKRAEAVAAVARSVGANVSEARGYGERAPKASNGTAQGRAANRRVEIQCIK